MVHRWVELVVALLKRPDRGGNRATANRLDLTSGGCGRCVYRSHDDCTAALLDSPSYVGGASLLHLLVPTTHLGLCVSVVFRHKWSATNLHLQPRNRSGCQVSARGNRRRLCLRLLPRHLPSHW